MTPKLTRRLLFFWLAWFAFTLTVRAERLPVKIYTSADGLGSSFIDYLMRDSRGFMWFCTRDGLSRFDGARFITYRIGDKNAPPGIEGIYQTRDGAYWITTTGGLYRFKPDAVSKPDKTTGDRPFLNAEFISERRGPLLEDRAGNLWYAGNDLYRVKETGGKFVFEAENLNLPSNPNHPTNIFQIREAPDGCIWLNTNQGAVRRFPDGRMTLYQRETDVTVGLASMLIESNGRCWVIWRSDLFVINPAPIESVPRAPQFVIKALKPASINSLRPGLEVHLPNGPDEMVRLQVDRANSFTARLYESSDGHVWLVANENLLEFDGRKFLTYGSAQGLPPGMAGMAEDSAGNLWIGGHTALARLDRKGLLTYGPGDGLASINIESITEGPDGALYFINGDFYLSRFAGQGFQTVRFHIAPDARALWTSRAAFLSSANEWWVLTTKKLYRFAAGDLEKPLATYDSHSGLKADEMYQIFEDSHGDIWLSQRPAKAESFGLYRMKRGEQSFYGFSQAEGLPEGKAAESFAEDKQGNLWFGFYEGGLVRFAHNRFTEFTTRDGLPFGLVTDLHVDTQGRLWMTSTNGGVARIDNPGAEKPSFVSLTTDNGLSSNNARTITEDHFGNIYVGTVRGIDQISPDTTRIKHHSVSDGLAGDFVVDSYCDRSGTLWFATTSGLSRLLPGTGESHGAPTIWLGGLRIAGEKQPVSELGDAEISRGELGHTQNNFQIDFFGLDFRAGESLRYQFILEGADSGWSAPTEQRTVNYANLQPGSYRFLVRAINGDGIASERPAIVSFKILPPLWLRWWFVGLVTVLVLAILYSFYRYRLARLREVNAALAEAKRAEEDLGKAREDRLTELERVRTRIATDLHDDIGASLTQIAILSEVAQQSIRGNGVSLEPLKSIANVSNELVETMSDIVWAINPQKDHLQDLIQRMRRFASDILSARGISLAFDAPTFAPEIPLGANARREVFLIFKESLTNIVKHSGATQVRIEFKVSADSLTLKITDNGQGFEPGKLSSALFADQKGGHGINSMKKRAAEMNGEFDLGSAAGQGTVITFRLPLMSEPPAVARG
jgi:signal transduction histidine kinase/ligand-binding sensor domain-containing protein